MISSGTKAWLRIVEQMGEAARTAAALTGADPDDVVKRYAHESVERDVDFEKVCIELGLPVPPIWSEKQSARFACEVEAHRFSHYVISEMVAGVR